MKKAYTTSLETLNSSVAAILDAKLATSGAESIADYVAFASDNIDANIERAKEAKKELDEYIKHKQDIQATIKQDTATWLQDVGVDKLNGMRVSSITVNTPAPKNKLVIKNEAYFTVLGLTKVTLDETAVKNFILDSKEDLSEFAIIETTHSLPVIKINKKRG